MNSDVGFAHDIDPVLLVVGPVPLYWYGLAYSLGFTGLLVWFCRRRRRLGLSEFESYELGILIALGGLLGARAFEIAVYEWDHSQQLDAGRAEAVSRKGRRLLSSSETTPQGSRERISRPAFPTRNGPGTGSGSTAGDRALATQFGNGAIRLIKARARALTKTL